MRDAILQVLEEPHPKAETVLFYTKDWPAAAVAVMNVVYAFSGQSAYVEIIAEMKGPHRFPSSLTAATGVMVVAYFGIGIAGYVSQVCAFPLLCLLLPSQIREFCKTILDLLAVEKYVFFAHAAWT